MHKEMTLNYVCIEGKVKFVLYDDRSKKEVKSRINFNTKKLLFGNSAVNMEWL